MASRPVFLPHRSATAFVLDASVEFRWFAGMAVSQKQKCIGSLHEAAKQQLRVARILEISSKSPESLGVCLSAFNLSLPIEGRRVSVEVAFQAGKMFNEGGPFTDLLSVTSREAKRDPRLRQSGRLIGFKLNGESWPCEPRTAFYDWLYLQALNIHPELSEHLTEFQAFTDIEFNPEKSLNCQARSAALYVSLHAAGLLKSAVSSKESYLRTIAGGAGESEQRSLF